MFFVLVCSCVFFQFFDCNRFGSISFKFNFSKVFEFFDGVVDFGFLFRLDVQLGNFGVFDGVGVFDGESGGDFVIFGGDREIGEGEGGVGKIVVEGVVDCQIGKFVVVVVDVNVFIVESMFSFGMEIKEGGSVLKMFGEVE